MITLKIWHGPMRTTLTLPLREAEIQKALVKAFRTAPFKVTADDVSPEALAMMLLRCTSSSPCSIMTRTSRRKMSGRTWTMMRTRVRATIFTFICEGAR